METIQAYVDNAFYGLPKTEEVLRTKENISKNMIAKYQELKRQGHTESEAVGKVISEAGDLTAHLKELGVSLVEPNQLPLLSFEQVKSYIAVKKKTSILISIGVVLCILGATMVCMFNGLSYNHHLAFIKTSDGDNMLSYICLFIFVACAVALFIYSGSLTKDYEFIDNGISLDASTKQYLITEKKQGQNRYTIMVIVGVVLCILSPISIFIAEPIWGDDNSLTCVPFLLLITIAVFLFVLSGCQRAPYERLLKEASGNKQLKKAERIYGMVNSIIMMTATGIFLIIGFLYDHWESAGIIYPIAGILCGICSTIIWGIARIRE